MRRERAVAEAVTRKFAEIIRLRDESLRITCIALRGGLRRRATGADMDTLDLLYTAASSTTWQAAISKPSLEAVGLDPAECGGAAHPEEGHRLVANHGAGGGFGVLNTTSAWTARLPAWLDGRALPMIARIVQLADAWTP